MNPQTGEGTAKAFFHAPALAPGWVKGFSHRGYHRDAENTLAAFTAATRMGYGYLETDVHTSRDHQLWCFHDDTLHRLTGLSGGIEDYTSAELAQLRVAGQPLLRLEELLSALPTTRINIDLKDRPAAWLIGPILRQYQAVDRVLVTAFDDAHRRDFFAANPGWEHRVASSAGLRTMRLLWGLSRAGIHRASLAAGRALKRAAVIDAVQCPPVAGRVQVVDERLIAFAHALDVEVHVWTINDTATMHQLIRAGVDGVMTDNGPALKTVLGQYRMWPQNAVG